ncbi:hypothetical protein EDB89DRAFT_2069621 [Lactarius sanguifluus]|nr:hypothetical protein EDB89DRAFT_2069621 [Lactarius sanguifluus]
MSNWLQVLCLLPGILTRRPVSDLEKDIKVDLLFVKSSAASYPTLLLFETHLIEIVAMLFRRLIAAVASVAFISRGALAALTPEQIVTNVDIVTQVSQAANDALAQLSPTTPPSQIPVIARSLENSFRIIVSNITADIAAMQATPPFVDCPPAAVLIVASLKNFVTVHQILLSTVIGKHSIFAQFGVTAPITGILRELEAAIDKFALSMINLISCAKDSVTKDQDDLDKSVGDTIKRYQQICIPVPLYPILQPICLPL